MLKDLHRIGFYRYIYITIKTNKMKTIIKSLNAKAIEKSILIYTDILNVNVRTYKSGFTSLYKKGYIPFNNDEKNKISDFCRSVDIKIMNSKNINSYNTPISVSEYSFDCGIKLNGLVRVIEVG